MPVDARALGQLVGDEDADAVAFDGLDGRAGALAVVAPEVRLHAGRDFAHHRLGDQVELLQTPFSRQGGVVSRPLSVTTESIVRP